jgi:hypothetical protein
MGSNLALLRRSLCASPWLAERISLFGTGVCYSAVVTLLVCMPLSEHFSPCPPSHPRTQRTTGLGEAAGSCHIVSGEDNQGDGIALCGGKSVADELAARGWNASHYLVWL